MDKKDIISGFAWFSIAAAALIASVHLGIGPFQNPGPGFLSFWASALLVLLNGMLLVLRITGKERIVSPVVESRENRNWPIPLLVAAAMIVYGVVLPDLGYIAATFGLMVALFAAGKMKLKQAIPGALLAALLTLVLFDWFLKMPLPRGFFAF